MKQFIRILCVAAGFALVFLLDLVSLGLISEADAIAGVRRRTARRTAVVVGSSTAAAASASAAATQQQQAATAQQQAATAEQQSATAAQQSATAQQQAAAPAPAPTAMVASLPQGCVSAGEVFQCGNVYYKPYMSGSQIVYGVVPGP
jgi:asparagine N-glycosylation enzyme membrane subunit Stt3